MGKGNNSSELKLNREHYRADMQFSFALSSWTENVNILTVKHNNALPIISIKQLTSAHILISD